jgi:hypothetical protein
MPWVKAEREVGEDLMASAGFISGRVVGSRVRTTVLATKIYLAMNSAKAWPHTP